MLHSSLLSVWLYDGFMLSLVASAAKCHEAVFTFGAAQSGSGARKFYSVLHSFMGWTLLLASGSPISRDLPYALAYDVLALWLLLNAIMHGSLLFALSHGTPSSCFQPTEWSQRNYFWRFSSNFSCGHRVWTWSFDGVCQGR